MNIRQWLEQVALGEYAEAFEALEITPHDLPQLTESDLKELGVHSLVHRRRILQTASKVDPSGIEAARTVVEADDFERRVLRDFPFPIAYGYRRVIEPESASAAVEHVFYTYTALLRFVALVFLGQFLTMPGQNPKAARALQRLRSPTLESWFSVVSALAKHLFPLSPRAGGRFLPYADGGPFSAGLAAAARELSRLRVDGESVHEQIRLARNTRYHGTPWVETECAAKLPRLRAQLDAALHLFEPLTELELLRSSAGGMIRLVGASERFEEVPVIDPQLEDLFEESETVLMGPEGQLLPIFPLFLAPNNPLPEGYVEPLLSFDGHGQTSVTYLGVRSWTARQDMLARYLDLLRAKDIDPRFTKADLTPWSVTDWARESSYGVIENLRGVKYFPGTYQERTVANALGEYKDGNIGHELGVDDTTWRWLETGTQSALIVAAEAGSGKTSLFCRIAERLLSSVDADESGSPTERADCVLLLLGGGIREQTLFERIRDGLGFSDDAAKGGITRFDELLDAWQSVGQVEDLEHEGRRVLILIDALNEAQQPKALFEELSGMAADAALTNRRAGRTWVRLLVSVRAERIETLFSRWNESHDTPFLEHPQNFAAFEDGRGEKLPYLPLRPFATAEAAMAYAKVQQSENPHCHAEWAALAPSTRALLHHPLMLALFHQAFAGHRVAPGSLSANALWESWLSRTFDPTHGGSALQQFALDLADACIGGGHNEVMAVIVEGWRERWRALVNNDPVRIAAELDPVERLTEAGLLRRSEGGGVAWLSDSLAEQVFQRALLRRDPELNESSLAKWTRFPATSRLDGALSALAAKAWQQGDALAVRPLFGMKSGRARSVLSGTLRALAAPTRTDESDVESDRFLPGLDELVEWAESGGKILNLGTLERCLLWDMYPGIGVTIGYERLRGSVLHRVLAITQRLTELEPDNSEYLRDLSVSYSDLGDLDCSRDPAQARAWFERALAIHERLAELEPDNSEYLRDLSVTYDRLGDLDGRRDLAQARAWFERALAIHERLAELEPDNSEYLRDLSVSYDRLGDLDGSRDPAQARVWFERALAITQRLTELEPDNSQYLRDLSVSYGRLGELDGRRDPAQARVWFERALAIRERLAELEPDNSQYLRDLSVSYGQLGELESELNDPRAAACFDEAIQILRSFADQDPDDAESWSLLASAYGGLAEWHRQQGDPVQERSLSEQAHACMEHATSLRPDDADMRYDLACTLARLGKTDDALAKLEQSVKLGYAMLITLSRITTCAHCATCHASRQSSRRCAKRLPESSGIR
jgi:Flp pilus assembly protein TadD